MAVTAIAIYQIFKMWTDYDVDIVDVKVGSDTIEYTFIAPAKDEKWLKRKMEAHLKTPPASKYLAKLEDIKQLDKGLVFNRYQVKVSVPVSYVAPLKGVIGKEKPSNGKEKPSNGKEKPSNGTPSNERILSTAKRAFRDKTRRR